MRSYFRTHARWRWCSVALLTCLGALGCEAGTSDDVAPDYGKLVPVKGTVKVDGKPLAGVVVTFLPPKWSASNGETDADGSYTLQTAYKPGALSGEYKVSFSYLVSADGKPQGLGPRSSLTPTPSMATAKEQFPPELSDLGRTTLKATVPPGGGTLNFDIKPGLATQ